MEYKYKYQGQERQDELGLNWDSFKWRNYDYAIGRFMSIDPLSEEYSYNSPYAFQENKLGLGRELEGLEMVSERSKDGKSVTLTMTVKTVNNSDITRDQFKTILDARIQNTEKVLSGSIGDGVNVNAKVVVDPNATLTMEFNDTLSADGVKSLEGKSPEVVSETLFSASGIVDVIGNTQENRTQVNVPRNLEFDQSGIFILDKKNIENISRTGTHEDLHMAGLQHVIDKKNLMNRENLGGNAITPEQRKAIIQNVELQQQ